MKSLFYRQRYCRSNTAVKEIFDLDKQSKCGCAPALLSKTVDAPLHPPFIYWFRGTGDDFVLASVHSHSLFTLIAMFRIATESTN